MRTKKTKSLPQPEVGTETLGFAQSYGEAESRTDIPATWIQKACEKGGARTPGGRIDLDKAKAWYVENKDTLAADTSSLPRKEQKLAAEIRRLEIRNDRDLGKLIARAWVNERIQRMAGDMNATRAKSESEDALLFAATMGDVPKCRVIVRSIWDRIMQAHHDLAKHLAE